MEDRRASASRHARAAPAPPRRAAPRAHPSCSGSGLVLVDPPTTAPLPLVVDVRRDEERGARTQLTPTQPSRPAGRAELTRARTSYREEGGPSRRPAELSSRQRPPATCLTVVTDAEAPLPSAACPVPRAAGPRMCASSPRRAAHRRRLTCRCDSLSGKCDAAPPRSAALLLREIVSACTLHDDKPSSFYYFKSKKNQSQTHGAICSILFFFSLKNDQLQQPHKLLLQPYFQKKNKLLLSV
jgi:hypothetical protein